MRKFILIILGLALIVGCTQLQVWKTPKAESHLDATREIDFNFGWKFQLASDTSHQNQSTSHTTHAYQDVQFDDSDWRQVRLPHDWSIESAFDQKYDGATAYLPGGIGWYRKQFNTDVNSQNKVTYLYFDGVYANSEVYLNGKKIGGRINGYSPFFIDITAHLKPLGKQNTLAVRVDHERYIDSRWYTGSGIYRDVKLITTDKLHIPIWGTYITSDIVSNNSHEAQSNGSSTNAKAQVNASIDVTNSYAQTQNFQLTTLIYDAQSNLVTQTTSNQTLEPGEQQTFSQQLYIKNPTLWDIELPHQYRAITKIKTNDKVLDSVETKFGVRTIRYDADQGFFLNGKNLKIKGVNLHHGAGLVGTAVPDDVWKRRLLKLQEAGVNAIRTAHNPVSQNLLNMADELGLLVQSEIFDEWDNPKDKRLNQWERHDDNISRGYAEVFQVEAEADLKDAIKRDRNHPSIIMWSIGNEIEWTYPRYKAATGYFDMNASGNYFHNPPFISPEEIKRRFESSEEGEYVLAKTAKKLSNWVKEMDKTRPITANMILPSVSHLSGYADALDIIGYSYRRVIYDYGHQLYPDKMIMGNENVPQWHEWQAIQERDFIAGTFLWTGIDYLGESHKAWPRKALESGLLDTAGFENPSFHMFKSLWNEQPHVKITSQIEPKSLYTILDNKVVEKEPGKWQRGLWVWQDVNNHWNYQNDELVIVEVLSNCPEVELFLNDKSLGIQKQSNNPDHILKWAVPFKAGTLTAKGRHDCQVEDAIETANQATNMALTSDRATLEHDGYQVAHVEVQLLDTAGHPVMHQNQRLNIAVSDSLELLGVDNGKSEFMDKYQANQLLTHEGKALLIVRAIDDGKKEITISGQGIKTTTLSLD